MKPRGRFDQVPGGGAGKNEADKNEADKNEADKNEADLTSSSLDKNKLLALLGLANRAGKLAVGFSAVEKMVRRGQMPLVIVATDIGQSQLGKVRRLEPVADLLTGILAGAELAEALGREKLVLVAVSDPGFVKGIKKLKS